MGRYQWLMILVSVTSSCGKFLCVRDNGTVKMECDQGLELRIVSFYKINLTMTENTCIKEGGICILERAPLNPPWTCSGRRTCTWNAASVLQTCAENSASAKGKQFLIEYECVYGRLIAVFGIILAVIAFGLLFITVVVLCCKQLKRNQRVRKYGHLKDDEAVPTSHTERTNVRSENIYVVNQAFQQIDSNEAALSTVSDDMSEIAETRAPISSVKPAVVQETQDKTASFSEIDELYAKPQKYRSANSQLADQNVVPTTYGDESLQSDESLLVDEKADIKTDSALIASPSSIYSEITTVDETCPTLPTETLDDPLYSECVFRKSILQDSDIKGNFSSHGEYTEINMEAQDSLLIASPVNEGEPLSDEAPDQKDLSTSHNAEQPVHSPLSSPDSLFEENENAAPSSFEDIDALYAVPDKRRKNRSNAVSSEHDDNDDVKTTSESQKNVEAVEKADNVTEVNTTNFTRGEQLAVIDQVHEDTEMNLITDPENGESEDLKHTGDFNDTVEPQEREENLYNSENGESISTSIQNVKDDEEFRSTDDIGHDQGVTGNRIEEIEHEQATKETSYSHVVYASDGSQQHINLEQGNSTRRKAFLATLAVFQGTPDQGESDSREFHSKPKQEDLELLGRGGFQLGIKPSEIKKISKEISRIVGVHQETVTSDDDQKEDVIKEIKIVTKDA